MIKPILLVGSFGLACVILFWVAELVINAPSNSQVVHTGSTRMLAVNFAHADHSEQNCIACHHNYIDDTGNRPCFECHMTDPEVSQLIETQFHELCRGCHIDNQVENKEHGPTRQCITCHVADSKP